MAERKRTGRSNTPTELEEALRRHVRAKGADYLKDPNITSVGVGLKNGNGPVCLQFTVGEKGDSAIEALGSRRIPETIDIEGHSVPTDVVQRVYRLSYELVEAESLDERRVRIDPIRPGVSTAHIRETAGTIGLLVFDRATGAPCILSNWHVLSGNTGSVGDTVVQPGPFDDNNAALNTVGALLRSHLGAAGDCALARIRSRGYDRSVLGFDVVPRRMARVALGDKVTKSGRTTGITFGLVRRVDVMAKIQYGAPTGQQAIGCFEIGADPDHPSSDGEISKGGDSGSAWLIAERGKPTDIFAGLHFAGETDAASDEHALACYSLSVQKKLDLGAEAVSPSRSGNPWRWAARRNRSTLRPSASAWRRAASSSLQKVQARRRGLPARAASRRPTAAAASSSAETILPETNRSAILPPTPDAVIVRPSLNREFRV
jgi:endonuclease G